MIERERKIVSFYLLLDLKSLQKKKKGKLQRRTIPAKTTLAKTVPASSPEHEAPAPPPPLLFPQFVALDQSPGQLLGEEEEEEDEREEPEEPKREKPSPSEAAADAASWIDAVSARLTQQAPPRLQQHARGTPGAEGRVQQQLL